MNLICLDRQQENANSQGEDSAMGRGLESFFSVAQAYYWKLLRRQALIQKNKTKTLKNYLTSDSDAYEKKGRHSNYNENHLTVEEILYIKVIDLICRYGGSSVTKILKLGILKRRTEIDRLWDTYFDKKKNEKRAAHCFLLPVCGSYQSLKTYFVV